MGIPQLEHIPEGHVDRAGKPYTTDPLPWKFTEGRDERGRRSNFKVGLGVRRSMACLFPVSLSVKIR